MFTDSAAQSWSDELTKTQILEIGVELEWRHYVGDLLSNLPGLPDLEIGTGSSKLQIFELLGIDLHDAAAGGIYTRWVGTGDNYAGLFGGALNRAVALHTFDSIDQAELLWEGKVQVGDGLVDTRPMKNILGPAVNGTGHEAEEIFHGKGGSSPMVGLHFGKANEKIGAENCVRQVKRLQRGKRLVERNG
jgi:hypothetical protein